MITEAQPVDGQPNFDANGLGYASHVFDGHLSTAKDNVSNQAADAGSIQLAQADTSSKYTVNLAAEEVRGGHTIRDHVGKTDQRLIGSLKSQTYIGGNSLVWWRYGPQREGSFPSLESANDFVNRVLDANKPSVDLVASGAQGEAVLTYRFGSPTGKEAYRVDADSEPYIRPTYAVKVVIEHLDGAPNGYKVKTSFPMNQEPNK